MARNRRSAYGGPAEEKEVVITLDRRLLYVVVLIAAFGLAVGGGYLLSRGGGRTAAEVPPPNEPAASGPGVGIDEASARATAAALGLPADSVVIVTPNIAEQVTAAPGGTPGLRFLTDEERAQVTPADELQEGLLESDPSAPVFEVNPDPERYKDHEVLSNTVDPNVDTAEHRPLRLETVSKPVPGPRLAVSDLNLNYTYDFGPMKMTERRSHTFTAKNVGTEDLVISRIYTGCGCTATTVGDQTIPPDGILPTPLTLAPNEEITFSVEYDARAEGRAGATSKYIQIFSNDPTYALFDEGDPLTHETRIRIVVEPQF